MQRKQRKAKTTSYFIDVARWDDDCAFINCMVCQESMIIKIDDIMGLSKQDKGVAVHRTCFNKAIKTWGQGRVVDHG
jgi:hypothetical protein